MINLEVEGLISAALRDGFAQGGVDDLSNLDSSKISTTPPPPPPPTHTHQVYGCTYGKMCCVTCRPVY